MKNITGAQAAIIIALGLCLVYRITFWIAGCDVERKSEEARLKEIKELRATREKHLRKYRKLARQYCVEVSE